MIPILNMKQVKALDEHTITHEPVASIDLMERACRAFAAWFVKRVSDTSRVGIVCGTGNNGGDGLGIARLLHDWNFNVTVWIVKGNVRESEDFKTNLQRLQGKREIKVIEVTADLSLNTFADLDIIVDAIFGSGLSRPAEGIYAKSIMAINKSKAITIAVDIPSGLLADEPSSGEIISADHTVTFQLPKLALLLPQSYRHTGEWEVVDIGLQREFIRNASTDFFYVKEKDARKILRRRSRFDHKGTYGHALLVAGSYGKMGAAVLASRAALRAGVGLLNAHIPQCGYAVLQTAVPEAMVQTDQSETIFTTPGNLSEFDTIGIGPGIGQDPQTKKALKELLTGFTKGVVLDADALNLIASDNELMQLIPANSILTPHPKEFERLAGKCSNDFERLQKLRDFAARVKSVVILKGAYSSIATPEGQVFFNSTGNPGMATGGTGDVLTGILTGLYAQGYTAKDTAILGVFLHGLAGDLATPKTGMDSLIASDLVEFLPQAFLKISGNRI